MTQRSRTSRRVRGLGIACAAAVAVVAFMAYHHLQESPATINGDTPHAAGSTSPLPEGLKDAKRLTLSNEQVPYLVATKKADGTIAIEHVMGEAAAAERVRANATAPPQSGEAAVHDR